MPARLLVTFACLCLAAGNRPGKSEDRQVVEAARKTLKAYDKAIISVSAVVKIEMGTASNAREQKMHCMAAIIDPGGMAVTSLMNVDPQSLFRLRLGRSGRQMEFECRVQSMKYRLADGTEVPARIVLKDEDLDLAFLAPLKPLDKPTLAKIAAIPLDNAAGRVDVLEPTILLDRERGPELHRHGRPGPHRGHRLQAEDLLPEQRRNAGTAGIQSRRQGHRHPLPLHHRARRRRQRNDVQPGRRQPPHPPRRRRGQTTARGQSRNEKAARGRKRQGKRVRQPPGRLRVSERLAHVAESLRDSED